MTKLRFLLLISICFINISLLFSQKSLIYNNPDAEYRLALELFNKQKYGAAEKSFNNVLDLISDKNSDMSINSEYYSALCALELFNNDAEIKFIKFVGNHAENPKYKIACFQLGRHYYRKKKYKDVIKWLNKVESTDLSEKEQTEYYFDLGYSFFSIDSLLKAKKAFYEITDSTSRYYSPSKYCYSHISYIEKNYEVALQGFLKLSKDSIFAQIIPYYISQIYYLQGNYDKVIEYTPKILKDTINALSLKRGPEISRILGEAYYNKMMYNDALPYLEKYKEKTTNQITKEDIYQLAYTYYRCGKYSKAIENFQLLTKQDDSIAQNSYYNIADCFLKLNQKKYAITSFQAASILSFDKQLQEDALFNYAKLTYDLSYNPYNDAIVAFQKYIESYPSSTNIEEANEYLINMLMSTKNYKDALVTIEKMKNITDRYKTAYQRIGYYRGVEMFNDNNLNEALNLFNKSLTYPIDKKIKAKTLYWKGEAYYRKAQYDSAITNYNAFIYVPGAISQNMYVTANYNIGYSYFNKKEYKDAATWFRRYLKEGEKLDEKIYVDACLRTGDSYFIDKNYFDAIEYYDKAANKSNTDADYAIYQKAISFGLLDKNNDKISTLKDFISKFENSKYNDRAKFELGKAYEMIDNNKEALTYYKKVVDENPNSIYYKEALCKVGLMQRNLDMNSEALATLKSVVDKYPATEESKNALFSIQDIYTKSNDVESFFTYVKQLPFANISSNAQDTITYNAVFDRYAEGNCDEIIANGFGKYIEKFPAGNFITEANYYKADCDYKSGNINNALTEYSFVISKGKSKFIETSLQRSAALNIKLNNYSNALENFKMLDQYSENKSGVLESRVGQMRCNFLLKKYPDAIKSAKLLLSSDKVSKEMEEEAHITIAKSALGMDSLVTASGEFQYVAKLSSSEVGAEAKYNVAYIYYLQGLFQESEKSVFDIINQLPSYDYWITKGYILLADDYVKMDNLFQAKHTLKSVVDNSDNPELIQIAQEKLNIVLLKEKEIEKKKAEEEIKVKLNNDANNDKLFEEPIINQEQDIKKDESKKNE